MKKNIFLILCFVIFNTSCYKENNKTIVNFSNNLNIEIINDNQLADNVSSAKVVVKFPNNFEPKTGSTVKFVITGVINSEVSKNFQTVLVDDEYVTTSSIDLISKNAGIATVKIQVPINNINIEKEIKVNFKRAYPEKIKVSSSSFKILSDSSFSDILLTTKLLRTQGLVSNKTEANIEVVDENGLPRGMFIDYKSESDSIGNIQNRFTMGLDNYIGKLYVIAQSSICNQVLLDSILIYSQKK